MPEIVHTAEFKLLDDPIYELWQGEMDLEDMLNGNDLFIVSSDS